MAACGAAAAAGCGNAGAPDPATEQGDDAVRLWLVTLAIAVVVGVVVLGLFAYAAIRWRRRAGDEREVPQQARASLRLEVVYTLVPLAIVTGLFAYSTVIQVRADDAAADPDVVVDATAFRWGWRFEYADQGVTVVGVAPERPTIVLPVAADVRFDLEAVDVQHAIWVPEFFTKRDMIPGADTSLTVTTTRTGRFRGYCAEYCGLDHARMLFDVAVVPRSEYEDWLRERAASP